jgi:hypothetical protein
MRSAFAFLAFILSAISLGGAAHAHFVWLDVVENGTPGKQVEVYFSESAEPGEPELIEKIAGTKVLAFTTKGAAAQAIELKEKRDEVAAKLVGRAPEGTVDRIEAVCNYGVVERGGSPFLLHYYATHANGSASPAESKSGESPRAPLGVQVEPTPAGFTCTVAWNGKPLPNCELVVLFPEGDAIERKTNDQGQVEVATKVKGKFAFRARHVEPGKSGEHNGKKYAEVRHYATLTLSLPAASASAAQSKTPTAAELLRSAREARAVWNSFPGFSADLAVQYNDERVTGKISITGDGDVVLKMPKFSGGEWLQTYMESVVQHRMPGDPEDENVRYADEGGSHAFGRKIALGDGEQDSVYRLADDVVREVNRKAGRGRFTISVLEVERNAEGKYLPLVYTMTFWGGDGKMTSTSTTQDSWVRVGRFDLPLRTMQVTTADNRHEVKLLEFSNHVLGKPVAASE